MIDLPKKISFIPSFDDVLPIAFGGASIAGEAGGYGFGDVSESDAIALLERAFDAGIRVYDSAPIYGFTESEKRIGKAFKSKREEVIYITKSGVTWHDNMRVDMSNSPEVTQKMLEQSLRDFDSDYIDLYMIHWPDQKVDIRYPLEVIYKAQEQGKVKSIGLCNTNSEDLEKATEICKIDVIQGEWNPLEMGNEAIRKKGITLDLPWMSWGSLDKGILTGRVTADRKFEKSDCRSWAPWWKSMKKEWKYQVVEEIKTYLQEYDLSLLDFAVAFQKEEAVKNMGIYGVKSSAQLDGLVLSFHKDFPQEQMIECLSIISHYRKKAN